MAKKPPIRVALDLETTGLHVEQDTILEVAAIKFQGETVLDTFETLVAPGRSIPYRIQRLTGITSQQLVGAPAFEAIAKDVQVFIGDAPIVGHSIPFDVSFLRRYGLARTNPLIDTFELATVLFPSLPSYNLGQVAEALGILVSPGRHRAMVDTALAMQVFLALHHRLQTVDLALLKDLASLDAPGTWPLLGFFRQELRERENLAGVRGVPARGSLGERFAAQLGMDPRVLSFAIAGQNNVGTPDEVEVVGQVQADQQVTVQDTEGMQESQTLDTLEEMQTLVEVIPEQAERPAPMGYQTARAAIHSALEQRSNLLMEVTLGGNDYTPTLLPALEWLTSPVSQTDNSPKRLVIACAKQQDARRLVESTLPRLQGTLKTNVSVAYLADRGGYLCVHRWFGAALRRTSGELTAEQARGLAKLGLWAQQTLTGERGELVLLPQEITAWERISSGVERIPPVDPRVGTPYERCMYRRKGYCFVSRAEERVQAASIVVTTHEGLLDDLTGPHSLLSGIERRVLLDADLLEEEINRWSSVELDLTRLAGLLKTVGTELPDGRFQGLLALAAPALRENGPGGLSSTHTVGLSEIDARMRTWFQTLRGACASVDKLFAGLAQLLEEFVSQGSSGNGHEKEKERGRSGHGGSGHGGRGTERPDQPLRFTGQTRNLGAWANVERTWQQTAQRLQAVIELVNEAERSILTAQRSRHRLDVGNGEEDSVASELATLAQELVKQKNLGQQALSLNESDMVYWLRMPPAQAPFISQSTQQRSATIPAPTVVANSTGIPNSSGMREQTSEKVAPVLYAQLTQVAPLLQRTLLTANTSTIFAGASLSVDTSFSYWRGRFGLDNDTCPAFSVVTEHQEQTLLYLPNDVPEPNMPQYQRHLDEALVRLATALDGQTIILYTSHAALRSSYATIKPILEARGILVVAQGMDGSPRNLWQMFSNQEKIVVLGAGSFWDTVGEVSRGPACIVVTRLPMPVLNDPPVAARAEHYTDQLHQLTVPVASLRLRRALNRLAWSASGRNAVVLFDRRLISKEYGATILHSLPHCSQRQAAVSHMPETILDWLTASGAWE